MLPTLPASLPGYNSHKLQLSKFFLDDDYAKKWNERSTDFVCLTKNGELLRDTLYRVGGMNYPDLENDDYFMLLKHEEAIYPDNITKDASRKHHLRSLWCIIDKHGAEKHVCKEFQHAYIIKNSCIFSEDHSYYNIETGAFYCNSSSASMESDEYVFLNNAYDKDKSQRGIWQINKNDGTYKIYQKS